MAMRVPGGGTCFDDVMSSPSEAGSRPGRELLGWFLLFLGAGALQLPALGRMAMQDVSIMQLEMMFNPTEATRLVTMLGPDGIAAARQQLFIDFGYLLIYGVLLWKACRLLGARAERRNAGWVAKFAPVFAWVGVIAALCDAVEDVGLLLVISGHTGQPWPALASGYASAKFVLLSVTALFLLVGWLTTLAAHRPGPADAEPSPAG
jgi:hypothetical protein